MIRRPPRSTLSSSSAASDVYKRQVSTQRTGQRLKTRHFPCCTEPPLMPCPHGRRRSRCKDCGGSQICPHGRERYVCGECGGPGRCIHKRARSRCKDCRPQTICKHHKRRSRCKQCGGSQICPHGRERYSCKDCTFDKESPDFSPHLTPSQSYSEAGQDMAAEMYMAPGESPRAVGGLLTGEEWWGTLHTYPLQALQESSEAMHAVLETMNEGCQSKQALYHSMSTSMVLRLKEDLSVEASLQASDDAPPSITSVMMQLLGKLFLLDPMAAQMNVASMLNELSWVPAHISEACSQNPEPMCVLVWVLGKRRCFTNSAWDQIYPTMTELELDELFESNGMDKENPLCRAGLFPLAGIVDVKQHSWLAGQVSKDLCNSVATPCKEGVQFISKMCVHVGCNNKLGHQAMRQLTVDGCLKAGGALAVQCITVAKPPVVAGEFLLAGAGSDSSNNSELELQLDLGDL
eukprot:TRINITY_DN5761_c0_g1_i1.p1 TRINITY_DN5761_c0_g1~~TRINITY_DN5761_c0_g1_i1.p1  ORF type:complete len:462 (-),score=38.13 TRINITY_DN5761_c0_g1_i1:204-1589(-)